MSRGRRHPAQLAQFVSYLSRARALQRSHLPSTSAHGQALAKRDGFLRKLSLYGAPRRRPQAPEPAETGWGSGSGLGRRLRRRGLRIFLGALQLPFGVLLGAAFALAACGARILRASHSGRLSSRGSVLCRAKITLYRPYPCPWPCPYPKSPRFSLRFPVLAHVSSLEATPKS